MTEVSHRVEQVLQLSLLVSCHYVTLHSLLSFILIVAGFPSCKDLTLDEVTHVHVEEFFHQLLL